MPERNVDLEQRNVQPLGAHVVVAVRGVKLHGVVEPSDRNPAVAANQESGEVGTLADYTRLRVFCLNVVNPGDERCRVSQHLSIEVARQVRVVSDHQNLLDLGLTKEPVQSVVPSGGYA